MSESDASQRSDVERWDLPAVEGSPLPRAGAAAKGVNVMHLSLIEREAWDHGFRDGHVEGVRKGEAELARRVAEVDVKIAALEAILGTLARPLDELDSAVESELTRLALTIAKHLARRELKIDPTQVIGIIRHTVSLLPLSTRNIRVHLHPEDAAIVREKLARASGEQEWRLAEDPLMARGGCRITTDNSSVDARLETVVASVMSEMLGDERSERASPDAEPVE
jgi:flagellar assembly protein FliH